MFDLNGFYNDLKRDGIIFCFSGPISQSIVEGIGETLKQKMELEEAGLSTTQKVFGIFVEQMQNILNYSVERVTAESARDNEMRMGVLVVGQEGGHFYVYCGNRVERERIGFLTERLTELNTLDKDQLKNLYRERRKNPVAEGSKGAGLGLIDMARKASRPIEFEFTPIDGDHSFFAIKVTI